MISSAISYVQDLVDVEYEMIHYFSKHKATVVEIKSMFKF